MPDEYAVKVGDCVSDVRHLRDTMTGCALIGKVIGLDSSGRATVQWELAGIKTCASKFLLRVIPAVPATHAAMSAREAGK